MKLKFLYGSQSGSAEVLAMTMMEELPAPYEGECDDLEDSSIDIFDDNEHANVIFVFVLATYGEGDYTISAEDFFEDLATTKPDLFNIKYAMFGLGDTSYDTYNFASKNADQLLSELGATRVGAIGHFDACGGIVPEEAGMPWLQAILKTLN